MNIYAITALVNAVTSIVLGIFIYSHNPKNAVNQTFGLFCFFVIIWSASYFFWQISNSEAQALFWVRGLMLGAIFISISYFHFILNLLQKLREKKVYLIIGYPLFLLFAIFNFTPYFVKKVTPKLDFAFWPEPGLLFHPFLVIWFGFILLTLILLLQERQKASGKLKNQIHYILLGTIAGYLGGITNYFLWYNIPIPPIGNWTTTFYLGIVAYAIFAERLFDIRIILTQLLVGVISILLLYNFLLSETLSEYLWKGGILFAFLWVGYLLIRSVLQEIKQREELQRAYEALQRLDQAKSEFLSIASHQLRTPLTALKGYLSMLLEGTYGPLAEEQQKPIKNMLLSNERLINLINTLLDLARIESGKMEMKWQASNIEDIIKSVINELKVRADEKNLKIVYEKPHTSLPTITLDQEKMRNVILNLVDNAIKYTQEGSITIRSEVKNGKLQISVSDTGEGMTQEEIAKLFESFSRGDAGSKLWTEGTGLGLYVAKQFVQMHKGKIWAESAGKGKGSTFFVELQL